MKPERRPYLSFLGSSLDYQESKQIEPEILDALVTRLREGDKTVINTIIIGHLRMVTGIIASSVRSRRKAADIEGAAFLALVEAVNNSCPHVDCDGKFQDSRLYDNNITYYITMTVKYAIKDEYGNDHILRMPPRTIRHKIANGEKFEDIVPGHGMTIGGDYDQQDGRGSEGESVYKMGMMMPFIIPIAKCEFPALEFTEALNKSVENETERAIVKLRSEGYNYEEIGKRVGLSTGRVGQIMPGIETRFDRNYK